MDRNTALATEILKVMRDSPLAQMTIHQVKAALTSAPESDQLRYHLALLNDAGLITGTERDSRLTWEGHEYLSKPSVQAPGALRKRR